MEYRINGFTAPPKLRSNVPGRPELFASSDVNGAHSVEALALLPELSYWFQNKSGTTALSLYPPIRCVSGFTVESIRAPLSRLGHPPHHAPAGREERPYIRPDFSYRPAGPAHESSAVLLCFLGPGGLSPAGRTGRPGDGEESEGLRTLPEAQGPL